MSSRFVDPSSQSERDAWVEVDLDAIVHNVAMLRARVAPARFMAVVKADAYGHGAVPVARAALQAGADGLAVALVQEGVELRRAGIEAPILVLSEQPERQLGDLVAHDLIPTVYSTAYIDALEREVRSRHLSGFEVHLKIDTGMNRVGVDVADAVERAGRVVACAPTLSLTGVYTHFARADDPDPSFTLQQLQAFDDAVARIRAAGIEVEVEHAANSAAALLHESTRRDIVRVGIAMYGIDPDPAAVDSRWTLRPALSFMARVSHVKRVGPGEGISYGSTHRCERATTIVTVPVGYADGVARRSAGIEVLIAGRRHPIVGVVTMDQLMIDVGDENVAVGDEVVLIGRQGSEEVTANDIARGRDTIGYEVVCALSHRLPRVFRGGVI